MRSVRPRGAAPRGAFRRLLSARAVAHPNDITALVTVVDLADVVEDRAPSTARLSAAVQLRDSLRSTSCVLVRDPRVSQADNDAFLNQMEDYFSRPAEDKMAEVRPDLAYQVGATPSGVETPRCCFDAAMQAQLRALTPPNCATVPTGADVKWRYFWRIGPRPAESPFPELNAAIPPVVPSSFPNWAAVMDAWGAKLLDTALTVSRLLALAYELPEETFVDVLREGPHLLAPTGTDLREHGAVGTVFAGYHYDMNFLTIHGRSRYPGLFVWTRDGTRAPVRLPPGCILLQAGRQLEHLTGGDVLAGMHEVVCTEETLAAARRVSLEGARPLWRVSSTVFVHARSDASLAPLPPFASADAGARYPPTTAGDAVREELRVIKLARTASR